MEVSNLLEFLKSGVADFRVSSIFGFKLRPKDGPVLPMVFLVLVPLVPLLTLKASVEDLLSLLQIGVKIRMDLSTPVLLIRRKVILVHALHGVTLTKIFSIEGVRSVCGVSIVVRFISGGKAETSMMVRQLNNFWFKIPLLV